MSMIRTDQLTYRYGKTPALNRVDLEIPEGAIYALLGSNGAGKTTLLEVLVNLLRPTSGTAHVLGLDSRELSGRRFADIGYISEDQELPGAMTVGEFLRYLSGFYPTWDLELQSSLLQRFDISAQQKIRELSRGTRMKAAFIGSLAYRPKLLMLDEPFSGLDPLVRDQLLGAILDGAPETTILLSTHDLTEIENVASHVGILHHGSLRLSEETPVLLERHREMHVTLGKDLALPDRVPEHWALVETSATALRFVHTRYRSGESEAEIRVRLPWATEIEASRMDLRSIYLATVEGEPGPAQMASSNTQKEIRL